MNKSPMILLVCGGRDYKDAEQAFRALDRVLEHRQVALVVSGGANGADSLAKEWAMRRGICFCEYPANWTFYGKSAGHLRNSAMIRHLPVDGVLAFPGGRGTANMVQQAKERGIQVLELKEK